MTQQLHDSGERRKFKSGAVRDRGDLKPRPDLISPHAQMREGMIMTLGAQKYALRNWEKGIGISECLASAQRHVEQYKRGDIDEDHLAQARWNLGAIIHYEEEIKAGRMDPAIDDMPHYATPKPGDRRINPETGQEEIYQKMIPSIGELQRRVDKGELLSDRENDRLQNAEHHPLSCDNFGCGVSGTLCPECLDQTIVVPRMDRDICMTCGASIPPLPGEGTCSECSDQTEPSTWYIVGPMRGIKDFNFPAFDAVAKYARAQGFTVISPAELDREHGIDPIADPGSIDRASEADPNLVQTIAQRDCEKILGLEKDRGDGLILLPVWTGSIGGRAEVALALWLGLKFKRVNMNTDGSVLEMYDSGSLSVETDLFQQF